MRLSLPEGFKASPLAWPHPISFTQPGNIAGYGYKDEVLLTAQITAPKDLQAGRKVPIEAKVSWLACKDKCVPGSDELSLTLPVGSAEPANEKLFAAWSEKTPRRASAFDLQDQEGRTVSLSDYDGKIVVLEWINWDCPFVKRHHGAGTMKTLASKYAGRDVVWLGINSTHYADGKANKQHVEKYELPYAVLDDHEGVVGRAYSAKTTPHMIVIDRRGAIAYDGAIDNDARGQKGDDRVNYVEAALEALLADKPVESSSEKPYGCSVKYKK